MNLLRMFYKCNEVLTWRGGVCHNGHHCVMKEKKKHDQEGVLALGSIPKCKVHRLKKNTHRGGIPGSTHPSHAANLANQTALAIGHVGNCFPSVVL